MNIDLFMQTLPLLAKGMGGLFAAMLLLCLLIVGLSYVGRKKNNENT